MQPKINIHKNDKAAQNHAQKQLEAYKKLSYRYTVQAGLLPQMKSYGVLKFDNSVFKMKRRHRHTKNLGKEKYKFIDNFVQKINDQKEQYNFKIFLYTLKFQQFYFFTYEQGNVDNDQHIIDLITYLDANKYYTIKQVNNELNRVTIALQNVAKTTKESTENKEEEVSIKEKRIAIFHQSSLINAFISKAHLYEISCFSETLQHNIQVFDRHQDAYINHQKDEVAVFNLALEHLGKYKPFWVPYTKIVEQTRSFHDFNTLQMINDDLDNDIEADMIDAINDEMYYDLADMSRMVLSAAASKEAYTVID